LDLSRIIIIIAGILFPPGVGTSS